MRIGYQIFIYIYKFILLVSTLFNAKSQKIVESQKGLLDQIIKATTNQNNIIWFHASSLGEVEQGKSIISAYKNKYPSHKILLTVYSPSAYNIIRDDKQFDWVFYLPHDSNYNAKLFIKKIKPIKAVFIKNEFWYNYIHQLHKNNIPLYYVSCIFRKEQYFFSFYSKWFAKQLLQVTHFFVQDNQSKKLLNSIGVKKVLISGDSRFESVETNSKQEYSNNEIVSFINNKKVLIAGSTWQEDEKIIRDLINNNINYKIIIVPHELNNIKDLENIPKSILLSKYDSQSKSVYDVLIIDEIGILSKLYRYADIAYIGGGFGKGIHNILEAIVYNIPVVFGPNYHKSKEAKDLILLGIAKSIVNFLDLKKEIDYFENKDISYDSQHYFKAKIGSVDKIMEII